MSKRIVEMDILRGMAILGVLIGHVAAETLYVEITLLGVFFNQAIRFAVPVFVFLSGMGLTLSKRPYPGYIRFIWERMRKLLLLYCLWTALYLLSFRFKWQAFSFLVFFKALLFGDATYHLYFVPLIIQFYLLYPLLRRYFRSFYGTSGVLVALLITLALQISHAYLDLPGLLLLKDQRIFLNWFFYFVLGMWTAPRIGFLQEKFKQKKSAFLISYLLCLAGLVIEARANLTFGKGFDQSLTQMRPSVILYSLIFGILVFSKHTWANWIKSFFRFLSVVSYELFLVHVYVLVHFNRYFVRTGMNKATITYGIFALAFVSIFSLLIVKGQRFFFRSITQFFLRIGTRARG